MFICVWERMKTMNDNMIVRIAMVWVIFVSIWVASTGFIKRGSANWVMRFLAVSQGSIVGFGQ